MDFYSYESETDFVFCVDEAEGRIYDTLEEDPYWTKVNSNSFRKSYPLNTEFEDAWYLNSSYKQAIKSNFNKLAKSWLEGIFDWESVLLFLAELFDEHNIEWYLIGSMSEIIQGVSILPHDLDIAIHTKDFYRVRELTWEYVIEPFCDNKGQWIIRYFGKLCVQGASVDIAADETLNLENNNGAYEKICWKGYQIYVTPIKERYKKELQRNRKDRIAAFGKYFSKLE